MKKIYTLLNCTTCQKILDQIKNLDEFEVQNIKEDPLTAEQLAELYAFTQSYEKLFSKRVQLYRSLELKSKNLDEAGYKHYLLEHYTFLARPVVVYNDQIFVGNSPKNVKAMLAVVNGE